MGFVPRSIVNGALLRKTIEKDISICVNVESRNNRKIQGKTTDGQTIEIEMSNSSDSNVPVGQWVEIIGTCTGPNSVKGKEVILFDQADNAEPFNVESHNMLVQFMDNCKDMYKLN